MTITELRYDSKQGIYIKVYSHIRGVNKPLSGCFSLNIKLTKKKNKFKLNSEDMHTLRLTSQSLNNPVDFC